MATRCNKKIRFPFFSPDLISGFYVFEKLPRPVKPHALSYAWAKKGIKRFRTLSKKVNYPVQFFMAPVSYLKHCPKYQYHIYYFTTLYFSPVITQSLLVYFNFWTLKLPLPLQYPIKRCIKKNLILWRSQFTTKKILTNNSLVGSQWGHIFLVSEW